MHTEIRIALPDGSFSEDDITCALSVLQRGGVVAFPTDTVYGLGVLPDRAEAIEKLYHIKEREPHKAIAVLTAEAAAVEEISGEVGAAARCLMAAFWPGALTRGLRLKPGLPDLLSPNGTSGVRMPDYIGALQLLRRAGALAVTSANLSGAASACDSAQVLEQIGGRFDLLLDSGKTRGGVSSTVVDCTVSPLRILRQGPVSAAALQAALEGIAGIENA